jgi:hypothetical protein
MPSERCEKTVWKEFLSRNFRVDHVSVVPHEIFRWDKNGIYLDCFFPVFCHHL